jgi:adenosylcobinamide-GDP ribazoletransferase
MKGPLIALRFLTALPLPSPGPMSGRESGRSASWFPAVGLLLGLTLSVASWLLGLVLPPAIMGALVAALWAILTGGLHIDGLADSFDGLMASVPPERRLAIMRDPRTGAFGVLAIVMVFTLKSIAIANLRSAFAITLPPVLGRWVMVLVALGPQAREEGMGAAFHAGLRRGDLWVAMLVTALTCGIYGWRGVLAFGLAHVFAYLYSQVVRWRIGGVTGDLIGASCELTEALALVAISVGGW